MYSSTVSSRSAPTLNSPAYFGLCAVGGVFACGIPHTLMTPIDLVKCNAQVNPRDFPNALSGFRSIFTGKLAHLGFGSGVTSLFKGWGPTAVGYSAKGFAEFGLYEYLKHKTAELAGPTDAFKHRNLLYVTSAAAAEVVASTIVCPFEAVKVRVQTNPSYASGMLDGIPKMVKTEGFATLYTGLGPLWARQVPYTVIKFWAFERVAEGIYARLPKPKSEMSSLEQTGVVFTAGYIAGVLCGAASHPADTMVSEINKVKMHGSLWQKMHTIYKGTPTIKGTGFSGLWKGFGPRVFMIGTLTGLQWFIYGSFKAAVGLPTPGASSDEARHMH